MTKTPRNSKKASAAVEKVCSFCQKHTNVVGVLVEGPSALICESCIDLAGQVVRRNQQQAAPKFAAPSPKEIVDHLNSYVIDQTDAKRTLAVAVSNHYKRLLSASDTGKYAEVEIDKSNVLLIGPTGSGKTLLAQTLAKMLNVPFAIGDATTLTEAGYVGEDVENLLLKLLYATDLEDGNAAIEAAERGILYIDEIDKIGRKNNNVSITRDVSGEGVQQALLKMIEGTVANVPPNGGRKHPEQQYIRLDTKNILFICGGTFVGLDKIVKQRVNKNSIGFNTKPLSVRTENGDEWMQFITTDDLTSFGMIPELLGRLPVVTYCHQLTEDALCNVLTEPKNALCKQFQKLFDMDGVDLQFEDAALREIARAAKSKNTGARGLRSVLEQIMNPMMYDLASLKGEVVTVTSNIVKDALKAKEAA